MDCPVVVIGQLRDDARLVIDELMLALHAFTCQQRHEHALQGLADTLPRALLATHHQRQSQGPNLLTLFRVLSNSLNGDLGGSRPDSAGNSRGVAARLWWYDILVPFVTPLIVAQMLKK